MSTPPQAKPGTQEQLKFLAAYFIEDGGTLDRLAGIEPQELEAVYALAYQHYNQAHWDEALRLFTVLCRFDHLDRRFHAGRAASLQMLKQYERALHFWSLAHVMDMTDPLAGFHIAECLIALGRRDDARVALETVVAAAEELPAHAAIGRRARAMCELLQPSKEAV